MQQLSVVTPEVAGPLCVDVLVQVKNEAVERAESFSIDLTQFNFQQQYILDLWTDGRAARVCMSLERLESLDAQLQHLADDEASTSTNATAQKKDPMEAVKHSVQTLRLRLLSLHKKKGKDGEDDVDTIDGTPAWNSSTHVPTPRDKFLEDEEGREAMNKVPHGVHAATLRTNRTNRLLDHATDLKSMALNCVYVVHPVVNQAAERIRARNIWVVAHLVKSEHSSEVCCAIDCPAAPRFT